MIITYYCRHAAWWECSSCVLEE